MIGAVYARNVRQDKLHTVAFGAGIVLRDRCHRVLHQAHAKCVPQERWNFPTSLRTGKASAGPVQLDITVLDQGKVGVAAAKQVRSLQLLAVRSALHVWVTQ